MKIRFRFYPQDSSRLWWLRVLEKVYEAQFQVSENLDEVVDVSITGPYFPDSDHFTTPLPKRIARGALSIYSKGRQVANKALSTGVQPDSRSKKNLWFSGENDRPPFGLWDCYLGFDYYLQSPNYFYLPLWQITSVDMGVGLPEVSYWGNSVLPTKTLYSRRKLVSLPKKFACAFVGKAYAGRLHLLDMLSTLGTIDIYGQSSRRTVDKPSTISRDYRFCVALENDLFPGYVTEKPVEAYMSGTIPIYAGFDIAGYLNKGAILNLLDFSSSDQWLQRISEVDSSLESYVQVYEQPLLEKHINLEALVYFLRSNLTK